MKEMTESQYEEYLEEETLHEQWQQEAYDRAMSEAYYAEMLQATTPGQSIWNRPQVIF